MAASVESSSSAECGSTLSAEKLFLLYVERGDVASVRRELQLAEEHLHFDINCVDPLGRSALVISIENENLDLIKVLLDGQVDTKEALLNAIDEEFVEAVELLLQHEDKTRPKWMPPSWESVGADEATFTPDLTPLVLAAHKNNYEILKILLEYGEQVPSPHDVKCSCSSCLASSFQDGVRHSRCRINAYRALASPSLIALTSRDPILTAFLLSKELRRLSHMEDEFKKDYQRLRDSVEEFAMDLLSYARTSNELSVVLNHDPGWLEKSRQQQQKQQQEDDDDDSLEDEAQRRSDKMTLARLKMSIKFEQKKFVAHPNVQQMLSTVWYDGMPGFRRKSIVSQARQIAIIGITFPIHSCIYLVAPRSKYGRRLRRPFVKFISHSASYCFFLLLLVLASQRVETTFTQLLDDHALNVNHHERGTVPGYIEWAIIVYVFGFVWAELKQMARNGVIGYLREMWNVVDMTTSMLYLIWMGLRLFSWIQVGNEYGQDGTVPIVNKQREEWDPFDPMLISEGIFGAANICSFLKMVHIFSVNEHLGPLQVSLGQMVYDIMKFFFIYSLVLFAFGCGLNQLLWYYAEADRRRCYSLPNRLQPNPTEETSCEIWRRFSNLFETSQSLFWSSFGLIDMKNFELTGIKEYTRFWGLFMFGFYSTVSTVVLLNLLIAMMTNSYQLISEHADVEWKFARSRLWISYFDDGGTLPPPFNIVPTPKFLLKLLGIRKTVERVSIKLKKEQDKNVKYETVMASLVRRYVTKEQRKREEHWVTEDHINEVKQDINTFRYELRNILRENGMSMPPILDPNDPSYGGGSGGRKERIKERRLLKGLDIGVLESRSTELNTATVKSSKSTELQPCVPHMDLATRIDDVTSRLKPTHLRRQLRSATENANSCTLPSTDFRRRKVKFAVGPLGLRLLQLAKDMKSALPEQDEERGECSITDRTKKCNESNVICVSVVDLEERPTVGRTDQPTVRSRLNVEDRREEGSSDLQTDVSNQPNEPLTGSGWL